MAASTIASLRQVAGAVGATAQAAGQVANAGAVTVASAANAATAVGRGISDLTASIVNISAMLLAQENERRRIALESIRA